MRETIDKYYEFRNYETGDVSDYLLFLVSEFGELVGSYIDEYKPTRREFSILYPLTAGGNNADDLVSERKNWTRNGDRHKPPSIADEVADVYMMLDRFALACGLPTPEDCLKEKMRKKGFTDV